MQKNGCPKRFLAWTTEEKKKNVMRLEVKKGLHITVPYVGLLSLTQVKYLDLIKQAQQLNSKQYFSHDTMTEVWEIVVYNIFWYEEDAAKKAKAREV